MPRVLIRDAGAAHALDSQPGRPALLLLYHSDCLHCQYELSQLDSGLTQLDSTSVVLLTTEDSTATGMFQAKWPHLLGAPGVQRAHIDPAVAQRAFGINATPAVFIVDPRRRVTASYIGEISFHALLPRLRAAAMPADSVMAGAERR